MEATFSVQDGLARIVLVGDFTFEAHRPFKEASQQALSTAGVTELEIHFDQVDYMDSAALGMLLLLRERFGARPIRLAHTRGTVRAVLDVANFGRLFQLV
ncbi:MAG: STAS domain-containing protein [Burkholderiales bacterium]|nr:STAS domain-containing protein [Burkholderiales bacterium]